MRRINMLLAVALVMGAMMVAMAAQLLPSDQGSTLQVTPQTTTQYTITLTLIPHDPYRAVCVPPNPVRDAANPVCLIA